MSNGRTATADKAAEKRAAAAGEDLQADLEALREDVTRLTQQIGAVFSTKGDLAWRRARARVDGALNEADAMRKKAVDSATEYSDDMIDAIDDSIQRRPYTTLALTFALGAIFGAVWRR